MMQLLETGLEKDTAAEPMDYKRPAMIRERVCIVGAGLMGGSIALALRPLLPYLAIVDRDPETLELAEKTADLVTDDLAEAINRVDAVILAAPVRTIMTLLADLPKLRPYGCMVMDLGSTKTEICRAMETLPESFEAIGGHPMCGKETSGWRSAAANLYRQKTFILCRNGRTTRRVESFAFEIATTIGSQVLFLEPETHDEMVAAVSHVPYLVASFLMRNASNLRDNRLWQVSASGFHDTSRVSGSDPQMMLDILLTNKVAVLAQIGRYRSELDALVPLLENEDEKGLMKWLRQTQRQHSVYRARKNL